MKRHSTVLSFSLRSAFRSAVALSAASLLAVGCGGAADGEVEAMGESEQEAAGCGRPPPPRVCNRIRCIVADGSYEYDPLPAGTVCNGNRLCDGQGTCLPPPPGLRTIDIPVDDRLVGEIRLLLGGSRVSIDPTHTVRPLVTGTHIECVDGPGPIPIICTEIEDNTDAFLLFSSQFKQFFQGKTGGQVLLDIPFPNVGAVCGGPQGLAACGTINQLRGDLGDVGITLGGSGAAPTLSLHLPLASGQPTVFVGFPYPNVDLNAMVAHFAVGLGVADNRLRVTSAGGWLDYDLNLTHFPDWLISPFYDIEGKIHTALQDRLSSVFAGEQRRDALARALTTGLDQMAKRNDPAWTGFREIHAVRNVNGTLRIDFVPN
jgi:hypothetical protein